MKMDGDVMEMRRLDALDIPAHTAVTLNPMGNHIMLIGLHNALSQGDNFDLTLQFDDDEHLETNVMVVAPGQGMGTKQGQGMKQGRGMGKGMNKKGSGACNGQGMGTGKNCPNQ